MLAAFSARVARGPSQELALATAAACTAMLPEVWPPGAADDLLSMSGVLGLLLRAAAVSRTIPGLGGFATLRACRAASELLAALLEASVPDLRQSCEASLLRDSSLTASMQSLSEALLGLHPDPRLNEAFLELLWRGLRRVAPGAALSSLASAHPALICLEERQSGLCSKLQQLSPDQLLADARGLALDMCASPPVALTFVAKGQYEGEMGTAVLTSHCIGLHQESEVEPYLELPWECFQLLDLRSQADSDPAASFTERFEVQAVLSLDVVRLLELGCVCAEEAPSATLELSLDGPLEEVRETLNHYINVGRSSATAVKAGKIIEEIAQIAPMKLQDPILVQESPKAAIERRVRPKDSKETRGRTSELIASEESELHQPRIERPRRTAAVKTAAKSQVKPGLKHCLSKPETKKVEPSRPPQDAVQRVLEEASRLAKEVADVQRQFRQSQLAVDARGSEATAFLDDIAQAGAKRSRVA
ncbi:Uncharacterized protein SCF082_LOCUS14969 [Durusdinium trenchii]|uniref:Uncharacterized protein n=1 Tax=Durusdinium trenchii TaxID=1381693 RepID=A0ABP0K1F5_9DINO